MRILSSPKHKQVSSLSNAFFTKNQGNGAKAEYTGTGPELRIHNEKFAHILNSGPDVWFLAQAIQ